ncbi:related to DNA damage-inducible protein DIN7 [Saccharomycodes ludwigii]|uniref:Related to DNA damage-inducible protein DIN7 n=1 Tax=Saccharomycodes ludwigii TaxID=36035 RepID=A0A376B8R4_9ASCO|nr:related to DNA damage-inducible protein DIN7 [Saccharomycodes ludwigii]
MGIQGLLPQLKDIQQPTTLERYRGSTLAIDGYAWLHRAAHGCCLELTLEQPTNNYLRFLIKRLTMLKYQYNIKPYLVFDGASLITKQKTNLKRQESREKNKSLALKFHREGNSKCAFEYFAKSVAITPEMMKCWIDYCKNNDVSYIVAPYEADPQLVYLEKMGLVDGIISEDSDLLVFGCNRLITKLNDRGECIEISKDDFKRLPMKFPLYDLNQDELQNLVVLSGCDYTTGVNGIGIVKAMKLVRKYRKLDKIILLLQRDDKLRNGAEYLKECEYAKTCFKYQRCFSPITNKLVTLNDIEDEDVLKNVKDEKIFQYIGLAISKKTGLRENLIKDDEIDHDLHKLIAIGNRYPNDHTKCLVNREIILAAGMPTTYNDNSITTSINDKPRCLKRSLTIDSFFIQKKKRETDVSMDTFNGTNIAKKKSENESEGIDSVIEKKVRKRKLCGGISLDTANGGNVGSKFFTKSFATVSSINTLSVCNSTNSNSTVGKQEYLSNGIEITTEKRPLKEIESSDEYNDVNSDTGANEIMKDDLLQTKIKKNKEDEIKLDEKVMDGIIETNNNSEKQIKKTPILLSKYAYSIKDKDKEVIKIPLREKDANSNISIIKSHLRPSIRSKSSSISTVESSSGSDDSGIKRRRTPSLTLSRFIYKE